MKKSDVITLNNVLEKVKDLGGFKFKYMVQKNLKVLEPEYTPLKEAQQMVYDNLKDFEKERSEYIQEHGEKHDDGSVSIKPDDEGFKAKIDELNEKYKENITKMKDDAEKYNELLNEEVDTKFEFYTLKDIESAPDDIKAEYLSVLMDNGIIE